MSALLSRFLLVLVLLLTACAPAEPITVGPDSDRRAARARLAQAAASGPVRLDLNTAPTTAEVALTPEEIALAAARGVRGLPVAFSTDRGTPTSPRLVLLFDPATRPNPAMICSADVLPPATPSGSPHHLHAVFCADDLPLADARAVAEVPDPAALGRTIWRTTARLFPDDYEESYGFNLFGSRIRLGLSGTFGF